MSSLCYCCCRLTEIRSCTQGSILMQCHCGKCLTLLKEKLNHKTEHSYHSALKWSKIRMTRLLQTILTLLWRMATIFFHCFYKINFLSFYLFIRYRKETLRCMAIQQISSIVLDPYFHWENKHWNRQWWFLQLHLSEIVCSFVRWKVILVSRDWQQLLQLLNLNSGLDVFIKP